MNTTTSVSAPRDLSTGWTVSNAEHEVPLAVPGDVHSALLAAGRITDPYWRDTETSLDWVHESDWIARTRFDLADFEEGLWTLSFDSVDCMAEVQLNGQVLGTCDNQFLRWDFDVSKALQLGENHLEVRLLSNSAEAVARAERFPFPVPYIEWNNRLPHYNFLRKTQCHAGWDWNIALSPLGLYGPVTLRKTELARIDDVLFRQHHAPGRVTLEADLHFTATAVGEINAELVCGEDVQAQVVTVYPGQGSTRLSIDIDDPQLWWPAGHGEQTRYDVSLRFGSELRHYKIGLRDVKLITDSDDIGSRFAFSVNGKEVFMRGANWIPADALPGRGTPEVVRDLLQSAVDANMNMLRVWGGGQYEPDWFYEMCSEMGLMVWQDFMFSCNLYPASDPAWLQSVRAEARQQIRRLSQHASLALWCGDNEVIGALSWFDESKNDRDRYLAMYARLSHALEEVIEHDAPGTPFWASSPAVGPLNFGDGWHDDTAGDMHFWDVWHSARDFEHYRTVRPRFCSEFGFQSFPSNRLIETFTDEYDRNVSSAVMDVHQRNQGGNSRIVETLARYFRFPEKFEDMTWMSQISQALAMKTAIEFWRSNKPRCMGTLFWQLNDTWPVASWASLEYGGHWKLTQYFARRFFAPVMVCAQPDPDTGDVLILAINDSPVELSLDIEVQAVCASGQLSTLGTWPTVCTTDRAMEVARLPAAQLHDVQLVQIEWQDAARLHVGQNDYLPKRPRELRLPEPSIKVSPRQGPEGLEVEIVSDKLALFVTYDHGGADVWTDNGFTLLPGVPRVLRKLRSRGNERSEPGREPDLIAAVRYLET